MTDKQDRWARINALFDRAVSLPASERLAWLQDECEGDDEVLEEVFRLLDYDAEKTGGMMASIQSAAADFPGKASDRYIGMSVGSYRIVESVAVGGMGVVLLAEHKADDFDRRVAVKLLPGHQLDAAATRRFVDERRILADLQHPNIARLIDGGTLPDGAPYIVMDYIEGMAIDRYCESQDLRSANIVRLVLKICDAVQYAHRKLVIHRDIKPSNIIVDHRGTPILLDFGIAKLLSPDDADPGHTRAEHRVLTPMYASPEQIEGAPITTAADVYGIGLLLYRLLTGQMPYSPTGTTPRELEKAILDQTPEKPSTVVVAPGDAATGTDTERWARRRCRELRGELDTILLTTLRKSPERRYSSVASLADDLTRFLENRPIKARGDTPAYVARKFIRRNRWAVGLSTATLIGALTMASYYTHRLKVERDTAEQTAAFLGDLFANTDPYQKNRDGLTVQMLLDAGIEKLDRDATLEPLVRVRLLTTVAAVQRNLGDIARAEELASEALRLAEMNATDDAALVPPLATLSRVLSTAGDYESAKDLAERMLRIATAEHGRRSPEAAQATHLLFIQALNLVDLDEMGRWASETYTVRKAIYDDTDMEIATGANALGLFYWHSGDLVTARTYYSESARVMEAQAERNELQYASLLHNLGLLHNDTGDYVSAATIYEESVRIRRAAATESDPVLPLTLYALAHTQTRLGDYPAAYHTFLDAITSQVAVAGPEQHMVAYALTGFGMMLEEIDATDSAAEMLLAAERTLDAVFDEPHIDQATVWIGLARLAARDQAFDRGRDLLDRAIDLRTSNEGPDDYATLRTYNALGRLEFARGDFEAAAAALRHSLERFAAIDEGDHPFAMEARTWMGRTLCKQGDLADGIAMLREAVVLGEQQLDPGHVENVMRRLWLAEALIDAGDTEEGYPLRDVANARLSALQESWQNTLAADPVPPIEQLLAYPSTSAR